MAWHRAREKKLKQDDRKKSKNTGTKRRLKDLNKKLLSSIKDKKTTEAKELLKQVSKSYQATAQKGVIHKNNASRHIARLTKKVNAISSAT